MFNFKWKWNRQLPCCRREKSGAGVVVSTVIPGAVRGPTSNDRERIWSQLKARYYAAAEHLRRVYSLDEYMTSGTKPVASLGLVSPGAAADGVAPNFCWKKLTTFFSHRCLQSDDLFSSGPTSFVHCSFSKFSHNFFPFHSVVIPLEGVTRGGPPPDSPSDVTVRKWAFTWIIQDFKATFSCCSWWKVYVGWKHER